MAELNRRDAIRLAFGMGDRIAMEREQQSAIEIVPGTTAGSAPPAAEPAPSRISRIGARLRALRPRFLGGSGGDV